MVVETIEGIPIYALPDCARCRLKEESPLYLDDCPLNEDVCHPDMCNEYEEVWSDDSV